MVEASNSDLTSKPLPPPPKVSITVPRLVLAVPKEDDEDPMTPASSGKHTPRTSKGSQKDLGNEKIGRWSDEEHKVFLDGLERHGKQWKTIASMIGTRTVVQVRTHAQKYFQKLEKQTTKICPTSTSSSSATSNVISTTSSSNVHKKRKSLPASLPSRKKTKYQKQPTRPSLQLGNISSPIPSPGLSTYPSYISTSSSSSTSEPWSVVSPTVVTEITDICESASNDVEMQEAPYEFSTFGEDPLEWLIHGDSNLDCLPESSLPVFPDLSENVIGIDHHAAMIDDAILNMADPSVTVQSLLS